MKFGELSEAFCYLVGGVAAGGIEEDAVLADDVLGDHNAMTGVRIEVRVVASEGARSDVVAQVAVEACLRFAGGAGRSPLLVEVALDAEVGGQALGNLTCALDGETGVGRDPVDDRSESCRCDLDAGESGLECGSEPLGRQCLIEGVRNRDGHDAHLGPNCLEKVECDFAMARM